MEEMNNKLELESIEVNQSLKAKIYANTNSQRDLNSQLQDSTFDLYKCEMKSKN
ncbi:MAG: hypothetical protein Ta2E_10500 [Mycoplasmoidaceae bacterium]|nr:MAG: hypothetical protein Ta2E_10500 [Mycoplasmoidaceae bacterium]